jgi:hypothetical protein
MKNITNVWVALVNIAVTLGERLLSDVLAKLDVRAKKDLFAKILISLASVFQSNLVQNVNIPY